MIDHLHVALLNVASAIAVFQLTDLWRLLPQPENAVQWAASLMVAPTLPCPLYTSPSPRE